MPDSIAALHPHDTHILQWHCNTTTCLGDCRPSCVHRVSLNVLRGGATGTNTTAQAPQLQGHREEAGKTSSPLTERTSAATGAPGAALGSSSAIALGSPRVLKNYFGTENRDTRVRDER